MRMLVTYDPEAGAAYVHIGAARRRRLTVELDSDTIVDYDDDDQVIGIEFLGVSMPEFETLTSGLRQEDVKVKGDLL